MHDDVGLGGRLSPPPRATNEPMTEAQFRAWLAEHAAAVVAKRRAPTKSEQLRLYAAAARGYKSALDWNEVDQSEESQAALDLAAKWFKTVEDDTYSRIPLDEMKAELPRLKRMVARRTVGVAPRAELHVRATPRGRRSTTGCSRSTGSRRSASSRGSPDRRSDDPEPDLTQLQRAQRELQRVVVDARETLDPDAHRLFVDFAAAVIAREAARQANWGRKWAA